MGSHDSFVAAVSDEVKGASTQGTRAVMLEGEWLLLCFSQPALKVALQV